MNTESAPGANKDGGTETQHLRAIWKELGVGKDGYLTIRELSTVCKHIGMDNMTQTVSFCFLFPQFLLKHSLLMCMFPDIK